MKDNKYSYPHLDFSKLVKFAGDLDPNAPDSTSSGMVDKRGGMPPRIRTKLNKILSTILKPTFFQDIPLNEIAEALKSAGVVMVQEDGTEWQGMLLGSRSRSQFEIAPLESKTAEGFYTPYTNAALVLQWERMGSGRIEVIGYIS